VQIASGCVAFDGHRGKRLIRARSNVLLQAMLGELQMNGRFDDASSMFSAAVCQYHV